MNSHQNDGFHWIVFTPLQIDTLLQYVYRGLAAAEESGRMLKWHAAAVAKAGVGSIVRVMVDRSRA